MNADALSMIVDARMPAAVDQVYKKTGSEEPRSVKTGAFCVFPPEPAHFPIPPIFFSLDLILNFGSGSHIATGIEGWAFEGKGALSKPLGISGYFSPLDSPWPISHRFQYQGIDQIIKERLVSLYTNLNKDCR